MRNFYRLLCCIFFALLVILIVSIAVVKVARAMEPEQYQVKRAVEELTDAQRELLIRSVISESDEKRLAQMLYGEDRHCGDAEDTMKQAAVIWCAFNRCDAWDQTVKETITHSQFHGWHKWQKHPEWAHELVRDVAVRRALEKAGEEDVGRVLPKEYLFFANGGEHERFRTGYRTQKYWDWSLSNPY